MHPTLATALVVALAACGPGSADPDTGLDDLALHTVSPDIVVPGSLLRLGGASFVDTLWGATQVRLRGSLSDGSGSREVDVTATARFVDFDLLEVDVDASFFADFGLSGEEGGAFTGEVFVEVDSTVDRNTHISAALVTTLELHGQLTPRLDSVYTGGLIFVNDTIEVSGAGFLLGGNEGTTLAVVEGCFTREGEADCVAVGSAEVPLLPRGEFDREHGDFAFSPEIAGIFPGAFTGTVSLVNRHEAGGDVSSGNKNVAYTLIEPAIFSVSPTSVSLGQYVDIAGGGFVGGSADASTLLSLEGGYTPTGAPSGTAVDLILVPEFVAGRQVRYVLNEDDSLGQSVNLRSSTGSFAGEMTPLISYDGDDVTGSSTTMELAIAPVKQVVYLHFNPSFVESLRHFGLRAVDVLIRDRVRAVVRRDYATINLVVRDAPPTDFAHYSHVDISGPDPNGLGLFGYDNTPGKDSGNLRLYDRIGGVNATTQDDGYPGYGGIFIESLFGFSEHPGGYANQLSGADPAFDEVFDPFRPDRGGDYITAEDLSGQIPVLTNGDICPATERSEQIACAIFVIGSLIGTTVSHEIGHSLGLANPYGDGFHNMGDVPNRLMDGGADRPFLERAQIFGKGPASFCREEYDYLRQILPTDDASDPTPRPSCY